MKAPGTATETWTAYGIESGQPLVVDDATFDPKHHRKDPPSADKKSKKPAAE